MSWWQWLFLAVIGLALVVHYWLLDWISRRYAVEAYRKRYTTQELAALALDGSDLARRALMEDKR